MAATDVTVRPVPQVTAHKVVAEVPAVGGQLVNRAHVGDAEGG